MKSFKVIIKLIWKILLISLKVLLGLVFTFFDCMLSFYLVILSKNILVNILLFIFFLFILFGFWVLLFKKTKLTTKIIYVILFLLYILLVKQALDRDYMAEYGYASRGMLFSGKIMNKSVCEEMNFTWDEKRNACDTRK